MNEYVAKAVTEATGRSLNTLQIEPRARLPIQNNNLYDVRFDKRHLIAKEYVNEDELPEAPTREFNSLTLLAALDVAPQPIYLDLSVGPVVVYEFMTGEMWDRRVPNPTEILKLAQLWQKLARLPTEDLWFSRGYARVPLYHRDIRRQLTDYWRWAEANQVEPILSAAECEQIMRQSEALAMQLAKMPRRLRFCRSDPRFANIIGRPDGRLGMVDWEDAGLHDPACALADLMLHPNQEDLLTPEEWEPFTQLYFAELLPHDPTLRTRLALYQSYLACTWIGLLCAISINSTATGQSRDVNRLPLSTRLRRYLSWIQKGSVAFKRSP